MPSKIFRTLQVHACFRILLCPNYIISHHPLSLFSIIQKEKKMNLLSIVLAILVAILSSTFLINPNTLLTTFLPPNIVTKFIPYNIDRGHRHRKRPDHRKKVSICDDFPKDFAPPDTNTTSYFCVDRNGCCNFTSVQSAVDAVPNLSLKRNIVLINSGIY